MKIISFTVSDVDSDDNDAHDEMMTSTTVTRFMYFCHSATIG